MMNEKFTLLNLTAIKPNSYAVLLTDYKFWAKKEIELKEWCKEKCLGEFEQQGMLITFYNKKDLTQFILYWG